jgi:hypothetical protein
MPYGRSIRGEAATPSLAHSPLGPYTLWYLAMRVFTGKSLA